jgi:hypothetical protein
MNVCMLIFATLTVSYDWRHALIENSRQMSAINVAMLRDATEKQSPDINKGKPYVLANYPGYVMLPVYLATNLKDFQARVDKECTRK